LIECRDTARSVFKLRVKQKAISADILHMIAQMIFIYNLV